MFKISKDFFSELFTEGFASKQYHVDSGMPQGSKIKSLRYNDFEQCLEILVEHHSFPMLLEGDPITFADPIKATVVLRK